MKKLKVTIECIHQKKVHIRVHIKNDNGKTMCSMDDFLD